MSLSRFSRSQHHNINNKISSRIPTSSSSSSKQKLLDNFDLTNNEIKKSYQSSKDLLEDDIVRARVRERCLIHTHYPSEFKPTYTPEYIHRLTRAAVARNEQDLIRSRVALQLQSTLGTVKSMDSIEKIMKHLHPERKQYHLDIDNNRLEEIAHHEYLIFKNRQEKMNKKNQQKSKTTTTISNDMKRFIRGKSPTTIASALLAEAEINIKKAKQEEETFIRQAKYSLKSNLSKGIRNREPYVPLYYLKH